MFEHPIDDVIIVIVSCAFSYLVTGWTLRKDAESKSYVHADTLYLSILRLYLDHPEFGLKEKTVGYREAFSGAEAERYAAFAAIVNDFLETIYDLFHDRKTGRIHPQWQRIFAHHAALHARWLADHPDAFEPDYVAYVRAAASAQP